MTQQADILKQLRKEKKLTLVEVSDATGVSKSALSRMESGETKGTIDSVLALANFYNVSTDYITRNSERNEILDKLVDTLIEVGIIDIDKPITKEAEQIMLEALKSKIEKLKLSSDK